MIAGRALFYVQLDAFIYLLSLKVLDAHSARPVIGISFLKFKGAIIATDRQRFDAVCSPLFYFAHRLLYLLTFPETVITMQYNIWV